MKKLPFVSLLALIILAIAILPYRGYSQMPSVTDVALYTGQWTLDIEGGGVGWLEVRQEERYLDGDLLWIGGSVNPVANIYISAGSRLVVTMTNPIIRQRDQHNNPIRSHTITRWLKIQSEGDQLNGYMYNPRPSGLGVDSLFFSGKRLPDVSPAPDLTKIKYGDPVLIFNGKDLSGWRAQNASHPNAFSVIDGVLVNDPIQHEGQPRIRYANIRTEQKFKDFNLKLEVNVPEGSNSGVYLRGMYEIQVLDSYSRELNSHHMGAVYSRIAPSVKAEKPAGTWQSMDITLYKRHVTVVLNGIKIIDNQPVYGPTGGAIQFDVFAPGPILLQGDHGKVSYRNMILTPIL